MQTTHINQCFGGRGVSKNDSSYGFPPWGWSQTIFWMDKCRLLRFSFVFCPPHLPANPRPHANFQKNKIKNKLPQPWDLSRKMRLEKCYTQMCLTSRKVPGKWLLRPKHFAFRILAPMSMLTFVNYRCVVIIVLQKIVEISLCSDNRFSENRPLLNIKETMKKQLLLLQPRSWCRGGVEKARFQQSASTHSGTGEKETLNINVVGKIEKS